MRNVKIEELPDILTTRDLQEALPLGKNSIYQLVRREDFPARRLGRKILVSKKALLRWLETRDEVEPMSRGIIGG
jgi:excisionase family DNA binding protein